MPTLALRRSVAVALVPLFVASLLLGPRPRALAAGGLLPRPASTPGPTDAAIALLVVPAPDVAPGTAAALRDEVARRLAGRGTPVAAGREPAPPDPAMLDTLRGALAAGLAAYESLDPTTARERLEAVTAALEADGRLVEAAPDLLDAAVYLGLAALGLGDRHAADLAFQRAIRLDPARPLRPGRFSPAVEEAHALARIRLAAVRPSLLRVAAVPEEVDLYVDGVYRGSTPLAVEPLAPGQHLLFAQAPGVGAVTRQVRATEFGPDILELAVPAGAAATSLVTVAGSLVSAEPQAPLAPAAARALAAVLGATRLFLVWLEGAMEGFHAAAGVVDLDTGAWLARGPIGEAGEAAALGGLVADWLDAPPRVDRAALAGPSLSSDWRQPASRTAAGAGDEVQGPVGVDPALTLPAPASTPGERDRPGSVPWYRRWYVWVLLGAGVAAGVAAATAGGGGGGGGGGVGSVSVPAQ